MLTHDTTVFDFLITKSSLNKNDITIWKDSSFTKSGLLKQRSNIYEDFSYYYSNSNFLDRFIIVTLNDNIKGFDLIARYTVHHIESSGVCSLVRTKRESYKYLIYILENKGYIPFIKELYKNDNITLKDIKNYIPPCYLSTLG